jgi:hypothetical protein
LSKYEVRRTKAEVAAEVAAVALAAVTIACGSDGPSSPSTPTPPGPALDSIQVGVAGNVQPRIEPGQSRQLFALGRLSDGTTQDLTNLALWQSSNPVVATVTTGGMVTGAATGRTTVSATYGLKTGGLDVEIAACRLTLAPATVAANAFGGPAQLEVTASAPSCQWSARSDAAWLPIAISGRTGSGALSVTIPENSTVSARTANIIVGEGASQAMARVTQDRPLSCSYVTEPGETRVGRSGGFASFVVVTDPGDCQWNATTTVPTWITLFTTSGAGRRVVQFEIRANQPAPQDGFILISGLSGQNPPGRHRVSITP